MAEQIIDIRQRIEKMRIKFEDEHKSEIYNESIPEKKDSYEENKIHNLDKEVNKFQNGVSNERRRQTFDDRNSNESGRNKFGERRVSSNEIKIGSRPKRNQTSSRQENISTSGVSSLNRNQSKRSSIRQQASKQEVEDASFQDANPIKKSRETRRVRTSGRSTIKDQNSSGRYTVGTNKKKPRDNSSRFDD